MLKITKKIVILCGHHGQGTGASGNGLDEFMENAWCSCALMVRLVDMKYDVEVISIQNYSEDDNPKHYMRRRQRAMKEINADMFVAIHHNAHENTQANGAEVFYYGDKGKKLTDVIAPHLQYELGMKWRGVKRAGFAVLRTADKLKIPAVYVEGGFISNEGDALRISHVSWPDRVAKAIADGIGEYDKTPLE